MRRSTFLAPALRFALVAAFIGALAPTLSYLFSAARGERVIEICTSFGVKRILVSGEGKAVNGGSDTRGSHCPYCLPGQGALFASAEQALRFPAPEQPASSISADDATVVPAFNAWRSPPAQAPPRLS